jgi:3-carboxy-cis,cis-muconate cycloisomerase
MAGNLLSRTLGRASFTQALAEDAFVRAMLRFERALAEAQAEAGVIPPDAAQAIATACASLNPDHDRLAADGRLASSLAIPLVKALTEQVRQQSPRAAPFVHYGSTSQDVLDTALVLCIQPCIAEADRVLATAVVRLAGHARRHASTVMLGRTLMQPATPITAGLKIARWAAALERCRARLASASERALCVQLGGAVGTLDALGTKRAAVRRAIAKRLGLADAASWHGHRDEWLRLMGELAIVTVTVGKIARDLALLSQPEIGEMLESLPQKGLGSSTAMPHKRNPIASLQAIAAATHAPGLVATLLSAALQEHERALGGWQAELATVPELMAAVGGALDALERIAEGLVVNPERMRANLEALQGLVFSERLARLLAKQMDRTSALALVEGWCAAAVEEGRHLQEVAAAARPDLAAQLGDVFSLEAVVADLAPVLEEALAGI